MKKEIALRLVERINEKLTTSRGEDRPAVLSNDQIEVAADMICRHITYEASAVQVPMTLRQQYAMAAMQGMLANPNTASPMIIDGKAAFEQADEMIRTEGNKGTTDVIAAWTEATPTSTLESIKKRLDTELLKRKEKSDAKS